MGWAQGFESGTNIAKNLINVYQNAKQQQELEKVSNETPESSTGFTPEQGQELQAAADSGQYDIGYDEAKKAYTVTPKADPSQVGTIQQQGVTDFMGKRTAGTMDESQVSSARQKAMAGIIMKTDPIAGQRMLREVAQGERDDQRFTWDKSRNEREIRQGDQAENDQKTLRDVDSKTAEWFKSKLVNPDGSQRAATIDDHLAASQFRAGALTEAGRVGDAGKIMAEHNSQALIKIQLEGAQRDQELGKTAAALNAGDLGAVKEFYNKFVPDGAKVTNVTRGSNGQINIERESLDGRKMPPTIMKDTGQMVAALASFKDPMALYQWSQSEFRNNLSLRADARAGAADGRAAASVDKANSEEKARIAAGVALYKESNPNATPAQLEAVRTGILAAVPKVDNNAPAEVKLAQAFISAGLDKDMESALRRASNSKNDSPEKFYQEVYKDALKSSYGDSAKAKAIADQALKDRPDYKAPSAGAKPVGEFSSAADVEAAVKAGKVKPGDRVIVGGKPATWK